MTMRITVINEDDARTAAVLVEEFKIGEAIPSSGSFETIAPKKAKSWYIHAGRRVTITEDPNAVIPK